MLHLVIFYIPGPYMLTEIYKGYSRNGLIYSAPAGLDQVDLADPEVRPGHLLPLLNPFTAKYLNVYVVPSVEYLNK